MESSSCKNQIKYAKTRFISQILEKLINYLFPIILCYSMIPFLKIWTETILGMLDPNFRANLVEFRSEKSLYVCTTLEQSEILLSNESYL